MEENKTPQHEEIDPLTKDKFMADHEFDGIRELANEPPYWLSVLFILSVLFAYIYLAKFHIFKADDLQIGEYNKEMAIYNPEEEEGILDLRPKEAEAPVLALMDEVSLSAGASIYKTNCAVCHLEKGQGLVGPNLTDAYWIHGGSFEDMVQLITEGVPAKGMISWKTQIPKQQIIEVASFIATMQGTNPPNPKAPEGEKYEPAAE